MPTARKPARVPPAAVAPLTLFGWRHATRLRTEPTIAAARILLAFTSLIAVWIDPAEPERFVQVTYVLLTAYLVYACVLGLVVRRRHIPRGLPLGTHIIDIMVFSVCQYLTLGPSSPLFVYFVFSLFCGALRWGTRGTLATGAAVLITFLVMGDTMSLIFGATEFELNRFIIRAGYLAVAAGLLVYLGQHEAQLRAQIQRLAGWPSVSASDWHQVLAELLGHAGAVVGAARVVVVWDGDEEPWRYRAAWSSGDFSLTTHAPAEFEPIVPRDLSDASFVITRIEGGTMAAVVSQGSVLVDWSGPAPAAGLLPAGVRGDIGSAPFGTERLTGRLFLLDLAPPAPDLLPLIEVVARETGASLDQLHVARRLAEVAASEERIRVARDLHDGVLQSLTGLRLDLQSIATVPEGGVEAPVRDRLLTIERAIAMEQRELRLFIAGLQPEAAAGPRGTASLAERLEAVRDRVSLEWRMPVSLRLGACPDRLPAEVLQGVPMMVHEAVVNALKHGNPTRVAVDVHYGDGRLRIAVADDGRGFAFLGRYDDAALAGMAAGPASLQARVASMGGEIAIESTPSGSRVEIVLPA